MAARLGEREQRRIAERGIHSLEPEAALRALDGLLARSPAQVAVLSVDWPTLLAQYPEGGAPALLSELAPTRPALRPPRDAGGPSLVTALAAAAPEDRAQIVAAYVQDHIVRVLALDPAEPIDPGQELAELGLDSLMAVELSNRLSVGTGLALPATLALEHPTITAIAQHVAAAMADPTGEAANCWRRRRPSAVPSSPSRATSHPGVVGASRAGSSEGVRVCRFRWGRPFLRAPAACW